MDAAKNYPEYLVPTAIGRYLVDSVVGLGGAGVVYRARDPLLDREVAIKVPRTDDVSLEEVTNLGADFYREAAIAGRFIHPNVVNVHDVGRDGSLDFMVMELVDGVSGRELIAHEGRLPVWDVLTIFYDICRALDFIHYHGFIHRDIKPGNILISDSRDHAKLVDFSVAHRVDEIQPRVRGSLPYMAPECFRSGQTLDQRSDLFGVGASLYEFLTGSRPFGSAGKRTRDRILHEEPAALDEVRDAIPGDVIELVQRALRKPPDERFQSALEFAEAIHSARRSLSQHDPSASHQAGDAYISLRRSEWFGRFAPDQVNEMLEVGETQVFEAGDAIVREGEEGDAFYLILHGEAAVIKHGQVVTRLEAGEYFGEIALVTSETRAASVVAAEPVLVWRVGRQLLDKASDSSRAGFYEVFMSVLVNRLGRVTEEAADLRLTVKKAKRRLKQ